MVLAVPGGEDDRSAGRLGFLKRFQARDCHKSRPGEDQIVKRKEKTEYGVDNHTDVQGYDPLEKLPLWGS